MSQEQADRTRIYIVVAAIAIVAVIMSLCAGALAGGAVAYAVIRSNVGPRAVPSLPEVPAPFELEPRTLPSGALVQGVRPGSPADEAGLEIGDIIIAVDGQAVDAEHPLPDLIGSHKPGDRVELRIVRQLRDFTVQVRLGEHPEDPERAYLGVEFIPIFVAPPSDAGR